MDTSEHLGLPGDAHPQDSGPVLSPIRPTAALPSASKPEPSETVGRPAAPKYVDLNDPRAALDGIRSKLDKISAEFANGRLNRAQFTAIYQHYSDKRAIIERLIQRNPETEAWKSVAQGGHTTFLRAHFEARPIFYVVFLHEQPRPVITGGKQIRRYVQQISRLIRTLWSAANLPESGVARKAMEDGQWLVLALGKFGVTVVVYSLQPSTLQANLVRDLHTDFERANRRFLERGTANPNRMVFPQRSLVPPIQPSLR